MTAHGTADETLRRLEKEWKGVCGALDGQEKGLVNTDIGFLRQIARACLYSDVDILVVIGNEVESSRKESVRIRRALRGMTMPMDVLVIPEKRLQEATDQSGFVYREALRHGRVVYDAVNDR